MKWNTCKGEVEIENEIEKMSDIKFDLSEHLKVIS